MAAALLKLNEEVVLKKELATDKWIKTTYEEEEGTEEDAKSDTTDGRKDNKKATGWRNNDMQQSKERKSIWQRKREE